MVLVLMLLLKIDKLPWIFNTLLLMGFINKFHQKNLEGTKINTITT